MGLIMYLPTLSASCLLVALTLLWTWKPVCLQCNIFCTSVRLISCLHRLRCSPFADKRGVKSLILSKLSKKKDQTKDLNGIPGIAEPAPLLVYDLWNDPYCLHSLHKERPDLVKKYKKFLRAQRKLHQALAKLFSRSGKVPLTPDQLKTLRSLGYIR